MCVCVCVCVCVWPCVRVLVHVLVCVVLTVNKVNICNSILLFSVTDMNVSLLCAFITVLREAPLMTTDR